MPLRSEDMPGPDKVEQMTAAPGETRDVEIPEDEPVRLGSVFETGDGIRMRVTEVKYDAADGSIVSFTAVPVLD